MRSDDLLRDLDIDEVKNNIKDADIVFINIGANELLDLFDYMDLSSFDRKMINDMINYIEAFFQNELESLYLSALEDFKNIFPQIIAKIKEYNPDIKIYVNNLYNPFANLSIPLINLDLSFIENFSDNAIKSFNEVITGILPTNSGISPNFTRSCVTTFDIISICFII